LKRNVWVPALLLVAAAVVFAQERKGKDIADHEGLSRNMRAAMRAAPAPQSNCAPKGQMQFGQQISDSVTLTSCISSSGGSTTYVDFWTLNATAGHTIQIDVHSVLIFVATVQDFTTGATLASTNDCGFSAANCTLTYTIPTSGPYLIGFGALNTGSYTLFATDLTAAQPTPTPTTTPGPSGCATLSTQLCLDGHYTVSVHWDTSDGRSGDGTPVPLTANTGYFWFFDSTNVELTVKVLDGHAINGHEWVFYGALSNVHYVITVTDTVSNTFRTYENPQGTQASVGDTTAF